MSEQETGTQSEPDPGQRTEIEREIDETVRIEDEPERDNPDTEERPQDDPGAEGR